MIALTVLGCSRIMLTREVRLQMKPDKHSQVRCTCGVQIDDGGQGALGVLGPDDAQGHPGL